MKAYSVDLGQKVIDTYNQQEGLQHQLAKRFRVSLSIVGVALATLALEGSLNDSIRVHSAWDREKSGKDYPC